MRKLAGGDYLKVSRTQEMGIRMALGADRAKIRSFVVWRGLRLAFAGIVLGIGAAFALAHLIASFFLREMVGPYRLRRGPCHPRPYSLACCLVSRSKSLNPMEALRTE